MEDDKKETSPVNAEEETAEDIFEVDYIMDTKMKRGVRYFYVRWKGFDETEDSWEPAPNLEGAQEVVDAFMKNFEENNKSKSKSTRPSKRGKPPTLSAAVPSRRTRKSYEEDPDAEEAEADDSDDSTTKTKKSRTSPEKKGNAAPSSEPYTPATALDRIAQRRMHSNLRWLDSDNDSSDNEGQQPSLTDIPVVASTSISQPITILSPQSQESNTVPDLPAIEKLPPAEEPANTSTDGNGVSNKDKKKKKKEKKSKKHKEKERERSDSGERPMANPSAGVSPSPTTGPLTIKSCYAENGAVRFVVRGPNSEHDHTMSLEETLHTDSISFGFYLARMIRFKPDGETYIPIPNGKI